MKAIALLMTVFSLIGFSATSQAAGELEGTVVIRFNTKTGQAEKLVLKHELQNKEQAREVAATGKFQKLPADKMAMNELDREAGASSWYWFCGGWRGGNVWATTPSFFVSGVTFTPFFSFANSGFNYFYYSPGFQSCGFGCW